MEKLIKENRRDCTVHQWEPKIWFKKGYHQLYKLIGNVAQYPQNCYAHMRNAF